MPESNLYGASHNLTNVRVLKNPDHVGVYNVFVDGHELHGVTEMDVHFRPGEHIQADITLNSVTKIDHDVIASFHFDPSDIRECVKFLSLQLQLDDNFREAWMLSIKSALDDLSKFDEDTEHLDNYDKAGYILDRIVE